jgi:excisionase family DNA binding protein
MSNAAEQAERRASAADRLAFTIDQLVEVSGVGRSTIYAALRTGALRGKKLGSRTLVTVDAATDWLAQLPDYPAMPDE